MLAPLSTWSRKLSGNQVPLPSIKIIIHLSCHLFSLHSLLFYLLVFFHLIILYFVWVFLFSAENKEWKVLIYIFVRFDFILLSFVAFKKKRDYFEHFMCQATKKQNLLMFLSFVLLKYLFPSILTKICCKYFECQINIYQFESIIVKFALLFGLKQYFFFLFILWDYFFLMEVLLFFFFFIVVVVVVVVVGCARVYIVVNDLYLIKMIFMSFSHSYEYPLDKY